MIINFRSKDPVERGAAYQWIQGKCFVDGREVKLVHFVDTSAGIVKSYDISGDGQTFFPRSDGAWPDDVEDLDGVMSINIRGVVRLVRPTAQPATARTIS